MGKKRLDELEADLLRLKEREIKLKQELALQRKAADEKFQRERSKKMYRIAEILVKHCGENVLDEPELFEMFIMEVSLDLKAIINSK